MPARGANGPWQFVRTYHPGLFPFPPLQLFDVHADPYETRDVSTEQPDVVRYCDHLLMEWHQQMFGVHGAAPDPMLSITKIIGCGTLTRLMRN